MRRKITEKLLEWKRSGAEKKCLVVRGARQTGKTYSIDRFAKENYSRYYRLDLHEDVDARTIFDGNLDPATLLMNMSAFIPGFEIVPGDTLIFIDEIQDCPNARASLKFLSGNPDFDVIASGSLMGLRTKGTTFIPVGSEENLYMNPMDFEEFLWALGVSEKVMEHIRAHVIDMRPLEESVFQSMSQYLRWYMIVGGMPEAVRTFVDSKMFSAVHKVQRDLLQGYQDDIGSYAEDSEKDRVERCFDSIAAQLSKDNKTFVYSDVQGNPGYCVGSKYFGYALNWLGQSHLSLTCDCVTQPQLPLEQNASNPRFKLFLFDTGLLMSMYEDSIAYDVLRGGVDANKGALAENLVACMMRSQGRRLFYYQVSEQGSERMELDFVTTMNGRVTAIEVKSGKKRDTRSLNKAMKRFGIDGVMLETRNLFVDDKGVRHYPLFAAAFMDSMDRPVDIVFDVPDAEELNRSVEGSTGPGQDPGPE